MYPCALIILTNCPHPDCNGKEINILPPSYKATLDKILKQRIEECRFESEYKIHKDQWGLSDIIPDSTITKRADEIGISEDEIRHNACHPCCFTSINKKIQRNLLYCTVLIDKKTYDEMLSLDTKIDNYISTNNNSNLDLTFGKLPTILHLLQIKTRFKLDGKSLLEDIS